MQHESRLGYETEGCQRTSLVWAGLGDRLMKGCATINSLAQHVRKGVGRKQERVGKNIT